MCLSTFTGVTLGDIFHIFSLIAFGWPHVPSERQLFILRSSARRATCKLQPATL